MSDVTIGEGEAIAVYVLSALVCREIEGAGERFAWALDQLGYTEDDVRMALGYAELVEGYQK